jgi:hypothetical protein
MSRAPLCLCRGPLAALIHRRAYPRAARAAVRPRRPRRERRLCVTPLAPPAPPVRLRDV